MSRQVSFAAAAPQPLIHAIVEPDVETVDREHAVSPTLTRTDMIACWNLYLPDRTEKGDDRAVPMRAALSGLPPAHVVVAGLDPLRGDRVALATRLRQAQVAAVLVDEPTLTHRFPRAARLSRRTPSLQQALVLPVGEALPHAGVAFCQLLRLAFRNATVRDHASLAAASS